MQNIIKSLSLVLLLLGFSNVYGMDDSPVYDIQQTGAKSFILIFNTIQGHTGELRIEDANGITIWKEFLKKDLPQARKYNLEQLTEGQYTLIVEDELRKETQSIAIVGGKMVIDFKSKQTEFKPVFKVEGRKLVINYLQQNKALSISLKDTNGDSFLQESVKPQATFGRAYDLKTLEAGQYYVQVETKDRSYIKSFQLH